MNKNNRKPPNTPLVRNIRIGETEDGELGIVKDSIEPMSPKAQEVFNEEKAKDILEMIRARQEKSHVGDGTKLREFLASLKDDGTIEEDYTETPIYRLGHADGVNQGYDEGYRDAYSELFNVLKAIETVIKPHIEPQ